MAPTTYEGLVCYVGHDHEASDGRQLEGGWHYTVVPATTPDGELIPQREGESPQTMPGEKLHLDAKTRKYRLAGDEDTSWHVRHHKRLALVAPEGSLGEPKTDEEYEAAHRHLNDLEKRMLDDGMDDHEKTHLLQTPGDIHTMRTWLERSKA